MTNNKYVLEWINSMAEMVGPKEIVWIDGSEEQTEALRAEACRTGELEALNPEVYPNCYLHRTAINDVARVEGRTYICTPTKEEAGNIKRGGRNLRLPLCFGLRHQGPCRVGTGETGYVFSE